MTKEEVLQQVTLESKHIGNSEWARYQCTLTFEDREVTFEFSKGYGHVEKNVDGRLIGSIGVYNKGKRWERELGKVFYDPKNKTMRYYGKPRVTLYDAEILNRQYRLAPPYLAEVLESMSREYKDGEEYRTFPEFCEAFGYNNDSIKDKAIFEQIQENNYKLRRLFGRQVEEILNLFVEQE